MDEINRFNSSTEILDFTQDASVLRKFFSSVFAYMAVGLVLSGGVAYYLGHSLGWFSVLFSETGIKPLGYAVMFAPLVFSLALGAFMERVSTPVLAVIFTAFAVAMGMSLSTIFVIYTEASITTIFFVTAGTFALFAFLGYTTKTDLTKLGMICGVGFAALIIVSLINAFFIKSENVSYVMSGIGVLLVIGLIAYQMQHLKNIAAGLEYGDAVLTKRALIGAFILYISFVNLFMMLLRLFGRRD